MKACIQLRLGENCSSEALHGLHGESTDFSTRLTWIQMLPLPLTSGETLGTFLTLVLLNYKVGIIMLISQKYCEGFLMKTQYA